MRVLRLLTRDSSSIWTTWSKASQWRDAESYDPRRLCLEERGAMQAGVQTIALPGIDLRVVRRGTGVPLLLLHGGDGPQGHLPFLQRLTEQFDVIAPTHPGFASSPIPEHFDALEDLVYLYLDLLDALDVRRSEERRVGKECRSRW